MTTRKVIEIVAEHLKANGYDGLYQPDAECGCLVSDLQPCSDNFAACEAGYKHMDPRPHQQGHWAVWKQKDAPTLEQWERAQL